MGLTDRFLVRDFKPDDAQALWRLMRDLAVFEDYADEFKVTPHDLVEHGFGPKARFHAFVAQANEGGELIGMAVNYVVPWTYDLKPTLVLKELFIVPEARGLGVGRALMQSVARKAIMLGAARVHWTVLSGNSKAEGFYRSVGGTPDQKWVPWKLGAEAITRLAKKEQVGTTCQSK